MKEEDALLTHFYNKRKCDSRLCKRIRRNHTDFIKDYIYFKKSNWEIYNL